MWRYIFILIFLVVAVFQWREIQDWALDQPWIRSQIISLAPQFAKDALVDFVVETQEKKSPPRGRKVSIPASSNGHYFIHAQINGRAVEVVVDTGATLVAVPLSVARRIGVHPRPDEFTSASRTANGVVYGARATLRSLKLGAISLRDVDALVLPDKALGMTLLGMSALKRLSAMDISNGVMVLEK